MYNIARSIIRGHARWRSVQNKVHVFQLELTCAPKERLNFEID